MTKILAIVGPTGGGKSALALALAEEFGGEIISCDSMQIYRRMDVGTAKPTAEEMARVPHHMIDVVDPDEDFSCVDYVAMATKAVEDCASRGRLPILCGGTGLYLDALLRKNDFESMKSDDGLRVELAAFAEQKGAEALWRELLRVDPESAQATHPNNVKRVIRALEIYRLSGITKAELDRRSKEGGFRYDATVIGLRYEDRDLLYRRIDRRVDQMLEMGLLEETAALDEEGVFEKNRTAAQAIGYKELLPYLHGVCERSEAVGQLKMATRRYAKRQLTWFSAKDYVTWVEMTESGREKTFEEIVNNAYDIFQSGGKYGKIPVEDLLQ